MAKPTGPIDTTGAMLQVPTPVEDWLVVWPIAIPMIFSAIAIMTRKRVDMQPVIAMTSTGVMVLVGVALLAKVLRDGPLTMTMGNWLPPFGISFAVDALGAVLSLATAVVGFLAAMFATGEVDRQAKRFGFYPLLLLLLVGVNGSFLTGDVFNLYVWFEVFVIASFGLVVLGGERVQLDGAVKYCFLNLIATALFLIATGYLYGTLGTLNMADLSLKIAERGTSGALSVIAVLYLVAFGMKAAAFPLYFWLPASYHTPKVVVSALFAGLLTKVGIYALVRTFTIIFPDGGGPVPEVMLWVAVFTMLAGVFGALTQTDLRRLFSFLLVGGIGVMLLGLALGSRESLSATVFYAVHSIAVMTALFMFSGVLFRIGGSFSINELRGVYSAAPLLAGMFLILGFTVAGLPPFTGFWPKALLVKSGLAEGAYVATAVLLLNGLLSTIAVGRAWGFVFWREPEAGQPNPVVVGDTAALRPLIVPVVALTAFAVLFGVLPFALLDVSETAAIGLIDRAAYIDAVLGGTR